MYRKIITLTTMFVTLVCSLPVYAGNDSPDDHPDGYENVVIDETDDSEEELDSIVDDAETNREDTVEDTTENEKLNNETESDEEDFVDILEEKFDDELEDFEEIEEVEFIEEEDDEELLMLKREDSDQISREDRSRFVSEKYPSCYPLGYNEDWLDYMIDTYPATRDQSPHGTCWAMATIAAAEMYAVSHSWADNSIDLSEAQLVYYTKTSFPDTIVDNKDTGVVGIYFNDGAGVGQSIQTLAHGIGPIDEDLLPYSKIEDFCNGETISDEIAYQSNFRLIRARQLEDDEIKKYIMSNGAVTASMNYDAWYLSDDQKSFCYCKDNLSTNHRITIVGWDDNYPKENFHAKWNPFDKCYIDAAPQHDGAWLIRNSSSTETQEFFTSYFWVYYDSPLRSPYAYEFDDNYPCNRIYFYDGQASFISQVYGSQFANVFTSTKDEELREVSFITSGVATTCYYVVDVYLNPEEGKPRSGELVATGHGTIGEEFGYYSNRIDPVSLKAGDRFSIVVSTPDTAAGLGSEDGIDGAKANAEEGQSYVYGDRDNGNVWIDYGVKENRNLLIYAMTYDGDSNQPNGDPVIEILPETPEPEDKPEVPEIVTEPSLQYIDGQWVWCVNGQIDREKHGFVTYDGGRFLIVRGKLYNVNGLMLDPEDNKTWYFCAEGQICDYTGLAMYNSEWFYVENGRLDTDYNGLVAYNGGLFYVAAGRIAREAGGLVLDPNSDEWYYVSFGEVAVHYTGLVEYNGYWFYVEHGRLAKEYTGTVEYDGKRFNVSSGFIL